MLEGLHRVALVVAAVAVVMAAVFAFHLALAGGDVRRARARFRSSLEAFGGFMGRTILTLFYFTVFVPFALVGRTKDPLRRRGPTGWLARETRDRTVADHLKMY